MYKSRSLKWFGNNDGFAVDVRLYTIASETVALHDVNPIRSCQVEPIAPPLDAEDDMYFLVTPDFKS
jgi:hypothetical protein